jgi:hypothetical protein
MVVITISADINKKTCRKFLNDHFLLQGAQVKFLSWGEIHHTTLKNLTISANIIKKLIRFFYNYHFFAM